LTEAAFLKKIRRSEKEEENNSKIKEDDKMLQNLGGTCNEGR